MTQEKEDSLARLVESRGVRVMWGREVGVELLIP